MWVRPLFHDRIEAGQMLARKLKCQAFDPKPLVLALPRGGVPVAFQIARILQADLDIFLVRKIGVPGQEELAMGAIASGGTGVVNRPMIAELGITTAEVERVMAHERHEIQRRERIYREGRPALSIRGRTVILVDDGLATGASMLAAVQAVRAQQPGRIIIAVPVAPAGGCEQFRRHREGGNDANDANHVICLHTPEPFYSVGVWYEDFSQTSDADVQKLLREAAREPVA